MILPRHRIRIAADAAQFDGPAEARLGREPVFWRGSDVQFELAFFERDALLDMNNLASVSVQVRSLDADGAPSYDEGSLLMSASTAVFSALTTEDWESGEGAQATLSFAADATRIAPGRHWLVVSGQTQDTPGRTLVFAAGTIEVLESGLGGDAAPVVQEIAYTRTESDARYLRQSENLADLADKALAREQLDVLSVAESRQLAHRAQGVSARNYRAGGRTTVPASAELAGWIAQGELLALICPLTSPAENRHIASGSGWSLALNDQQLVFTRQSDGTAESFVGGEVPLNRFSWVRVKMADGARPEVWLDGQKLTPSGATELTGTPAEETGVLYIGQKSNDTLAFPGLIARVLPLNFHLSDGQWRTFLVSGVLPHSKVGSQVNAVGYLGTAGAVDLSGDIDDFTMTVEAGQQGFVRITPTANTSTLPLGPGYYRMSFHVEILSGGSDVPAGLYSPFGGLFQNSHATLTTEGAYEVWMARDASYGNLQFSLTPTQVTQSIRITQMKVLMLGPLWLGDPGAQAGQVIDRAHGHHGRDSGTVALWPQAPDTGTWIEPALTADGVLGFTPDHLYRVASISVVADAGVTGFKLGTTAGGADVVAATDMTADSPLELELGQRLQSGALYYSASAWNGATLSLNLRWERVRW